MFYLHVIGHCVPQHESQKLQSSPTYQRTKNPFSSAHHPKASCIDAAGLCRSSAALSDERNKVYPPSPRTKIKMKRGIDRMNENLKKKKVLKENINHVFLHSLTYNFKWKATDSIWPSKNVVFSFTGRQRTVTLKRRSNPSSNTQKHLAITDSPTLFFVWNFKVLVPSHHKIHQVRAELHHCWFFFWVSEDLLLALATLQTLSPRVYPARAVAITVHNSASVDVCASKTSPVTDTSSKELFIILTD